MGVPAPPVCAWLTQSLSHPSTYFDAQVCKVTFKHVTQPPFSAHFVLPATPKGSACTPLDQNCTRHWGSLLMCLHRKCEVIHLPPMNLRGTCLCPYSTLPNTNFILPILTATCKQSGCEPNPSLFCSVLLLILMFALHLVSKLILYSLFVMFQGRDTWWRNNLTSHEIGIVRYTSY